MIQDSAQLHTLIEDGLAQLRHSYAQPGSLYEPIFYVLNLGGKRSRPLLSLLAYQALCSRPLNEAMPVALAVELFHNFTLMHDDIMDRAATRRGQPSAHEVYGSDAALLSGDMMLAMSFALLGQAPAAQQPALYARFALAAREVCEGQARDMALAQQPEATQDEYLLMIEQKTAALLGGALAMGALAAGADDEVVQRLDAYGRALGIAFQLQDDYMDLYAGSAFGKTIGGDILQDKTTALWVMAWQKGSAEQRQQLLAWRGKQHDDEAKISAVSAIYDACQAAHQVQRLITQYYTQAQQLLQPLLHLQGMQHLAGYLTLLQQRVS